MPKTGFRADLQMLRAIAVVLVILDHAELLQRLPGHPLGGFIGVDIFFVISGFLITSHLVEELLSTGRISFANFYRRRARRILPMAALVVGVIILASYALFWTSQANRHALDGVWSLLFVANVAFAVSGIDYFATDAPSIFQHYWSLSVEEQFYILWPVVILLGASLAFRIGRRPRLTLAIVAAGVGVISLIWACIDTSLSPVSAYFSTPTRAFEFAAGAILAIGAPLMARTPNVIRTSLALAGVAGIAASVWVIDPAQGFPGPMALLPVLATTMAIAAGTGKAGGQRLPWLTSRPVSYVGGISYSLYLWHWPVIVIATAFIPSSGVAVALSLAVTAGLSALSYRYVEQPVLRSAWLQRRGERPARSTRKFRAISMMGAGLLVSSLVITGGAAFARSAESDSVAESLEPPIQPVAVSELVSELQPKISRSVQESTWEALRPSVDDLGEGIPPSLEDCWTDRLEVFDTCVRGDPDAASTVALFGDSIAMTHAPALLSLLESMDMNLRIYAKAGCPPADVSVRSTDGSVYDQCDSFRSRALDEMASAPPDLVLAASSVSFETVDSSGRPDRDIAVANGWSRTLERLSPLTRVAILTAPPPGPDLSVCANRFNTPSSCVTTVGEAWVTSRSIATERTAQFGETVIDTGLWYCTTDGVCPATVDDLIVRRDRTHLTTEYSRSIAPILGAWIAELLARQI